jgi:hypothetical protein
MIVAIKSRGQRILHLSVRKKTQKEEMNAVVMLSSTWVAFSHFKRLQKPLAKQTLNRSGKTMAIIRMSERNPQPKDWTTGQKSVVLGYVHWTTLTKRKTDIATETTVPRNAHPQRVG